MKRKIKKILKQVPPGYYQKLNFLQQLWHNGKIRAVRSLALGNYERMLDLGCCDGTMTAKFFSFLPKLKSATGVDLCHSSIKYARKRYPGIRFLVADVQDTKLKEEFDLIICMETIEHVQNPQQLVAEIHRLLSKNGTAIIEMDSGNWLFKIVWKFWRKMKGRVWEGAHLWHTNKDCLLHLLNESDLKIEKIVDFNLGMGVAIKLKVKSKKSKVKSDEY